ncbi:hypothetical protein Tco_0083683 [Tanacetum coccineum]
MIAYLQKNYGNAEFHEIIDFLTRSSIYYALTVSPVVSTTFVEQFWTSAKAKTINNDRYITAIVAGKPMTISEASIRSDLLFDDADGIDSLNNQVIFDTIQLMGPSPSISIPDPNLEVSGGNHGGQSSNDTSLSGNEDGLTLQIKKLKKRAKPLITHHKAWMKSVAMKTRLTRKTSLKKKGMHKESVSKQGRKSAKSDPVVQKDPAFEDLDDFVDVDDTLDFMMSENAQDKGRTSSVVIEEKESADKGVSTDKPKLSTDMLKVSTDKLKVTTDKQNISTDKDDKGTKEKEKGVEIKNVEDTDKPRPTSTRFVLTLRPLPKINLKDKGKKRIEEEDESDTESEDITKAEKKSGEEEATKAALTNEYDFIQARINADRILAKEL